MNEEDLIANLDVYIRELLEVNKDINKQLQSYKQKEDKLREFIENHLLFTENYDFDFEGVNEDILQILNEGE